MDYTTVSPPNIGWLQVKLSKDEVNFLWNSIRNVNKGKKYRINNVLAGNISNSYSLDMGYGEKFFNNTLIKLCNAYRQEQRMYNSRYPFDDRKSIYKLSTWWVNYQKQTEFNPIHDHSGFFSFGIWMDIPTDWEDQVKLPISRDSNNECVSSFAINYSNILGGHETYTYNLSPEFNGRMLFFPSALKHQVYPFYNCNKERISISGNIIET